MKLSILIVTMNRAQQLSEAIRSCLNCVLPKQTEFIIIDNASIDNTYEIVTTLKQESPYDIKYFKMAENIGVGGGRNYAIQHASGEIIYVLDDDAVIAESNPEFFIEAIKILTENKTYATLTTQIYDTAWGKNRLNETSLPLKNNIYKCYMPCGGSHFIKRSYFDIPIYFPNIYGYEEIPTAFQAVEKGYLNVFCTTLLVIHQPLINKWDMKKNPQLYINAFASQYAIKKILYPSIISPILWTIYQIRYFKYLRNSNMRSLGAHIIADLCNKGGDFKHIRLSTFFRLYKDFGLSVL